MVDEKTETNENETEKESTSPQVLCAVSKQMVPMDETVGIERKKGEFLRVLAKYKKYD